MGFLDHLWDDTVAGPAPPKGLAALKKATTFTDGGDPTTPTTNKTFRRSLSLDTENINVNTSGIEGLVSPTPPVTPSTASPKANVWRSVFHPGSNSATTTIGANKFDNALPNSKTVYDWMYSSDTRSKYR